MARKLFLLDLDDTLIDTGKIKAHIPVFLENEFGIQTADFAIEYERLKTDNRGVYSLESHIAKHRKFPKSMIKGKFLKYFGRLDLLLPHTVPLLTKLFESENNVVAIFTFGDPFYQRLKTGLHPLLQKPELIVATGSKISYLKANLKEDGDNVKFGVLPHVFQKVVYIDDKFDEGVEDIRYLKTYKVEAGFLDVNLIFENEKN